METECMFECTGLTGLNIFVIVSIYLSIYLSIFSLLFPAIFPTLPLSSRVCVSPAQMCQPEVCQHWLPCHRSWGSSCGSVWGRWRPSFSGRWPSWRRRRASSTMKQRPTANAPRARSIPSWRGSLSLRKVSDTLGAVKTLAIFTVMPDFFFVWKI